MGVRYGIRLFARVGAVCLCIALFTWRALGVLSGLRNGDEHPLLAFPLAVIFPTVLVAILVMLPPAQTREGLLMRVGTIIQLLLIIGLPSLALRLALGVPVVFLIVELLETRLSPALRDRLAGFVVT